MEVMREEADGVHSRVVDQDLCGVGAMVSFGMHAEAGLGGCRRGTSSTITS